MEIPNATPKIRTFLDVRGEEFVQLLAAEINCSFTFEYLNHADPTKNLSHLEYHYEGQRFGSISELIEELPAIMPGYTIIRDEHDRTVVHLIDKDLTTLDDYALDKKISLKYEGLLDDAIQQCAKLGPKIYLTTSAGSFIFFEWDSHVKIDAETQTMRQILTQAAGRDQIGRILWHSRTAKRDQSGMPTEDYFTSAVFHWQYESMIKHFGSAP